VLTILFLVALAYLLSMVKNIKFKTTTSDNVVQKVNQTLLAQHIFCSPNTSEIKILMDATMKYLQSPLPVLSFYNSSAEAEQAYLDITTGVHAPNSRVLGVNFEELAVPSSVRYSLRFRAHEVANTKIFFNHVRK